MLSQRLLDNVRRMHKTIFGANCPFHLHGRIAIARFTEQSTQRRPNHPRGKMLCRQSHGNAAPFQMGRNRRLIKAAGNHNHRLAFPQCLERRIEAAVTDYNVCPPDYLKLGKVFHHNRVAG